MKTLKFGMSTGKTAGMLAVIVALVLLLSGVAAQAQTATTSPDGWQYNLVVYGWGSGISGDVGPSMKQYQAHVSASDLLSNLKFAGMLHFEAHCDKWGILVDPLYVNLGKTVNTKQGDWPIDLGLESWIVGLAGSYQIHKSPEASLDFTFGGRYNSMSTDITLRYYPTFHKGISWLDPVIGLKGGVKLGKAWTFGYRGDIGGFGVGSQLTWSGVLSLDAQVSKSVSINFGYIALYNDYKTGSGPKEFTYKATMMGPFLGVGFKW